MKKVFALLLAGVILITPLFILTAFAETEILPVGNYNYLYSFTWERLFQYIQLFAAEIAMIAATVVLFFHILYGNKKLLVAGGILCILAGVAILFLPAGIRDALYRYEFINYRNSFMWHILYDASPSFDLFIQSLKYIPLTAGLILSGIGYIHHKDISSENIP